MADANQDGRLSLSEARARIPRLLKEFSALDADGDGTLSRSEYATYVHSRYRLLGTKAT
ncbi:EF hand [compost metagenome]